MIRRFPIVPALIQISIWALFSLSLTSLVGQTVYEQLELQSPLPTPNHLNGLWVGNGKFLAATERAGIILSSDDGINWESHQTGWWGSINDIAYGNGLYCAVSAGSGSVFFSSDLTHWTEVFSYNFPSNCDNVYFHDGLFYFGGNQFGDDSGIHTTSDGVSFNELVTPGEDEVRDIIFANNQFVAVGDNLEVMTSPDGVAWTLQTVDVGIGETELGRGLLSIRYLNSLYVAGGKDKTILTSPDGVAWTKRDFEEDTSWFFDSYYEGGTYYFPGRNGKLWTTTDWATWTAIETGATDDVYSIVKAKGISVVVGRSGTIVTSANLSTWISRKTGYEANFAAVVYGGTQGSEVFLITDFEGNILKSTDGITWETAFTPGIDLNMQFLVYEDNKFVAMTGKGEWILSVDGDLWSLPTDGFDGFISLSALEYLNDLWWVVGRDGFLRSSTNLTNWNVHDVATSEDFEDIALGNGTYVAVGTTGIIYSSPDGSAWTERTSGTTNRLSGVSFGNGKFVAVGSSRTALTSEDGINWTAEGQVNNPFSLTRITFNDGQFVIFESSGRFSLSSDGLSWTQVSADVSTNIRSTAVSDTTMVAVGNDGLIMTGELPPPKNLTVSIEGEGSVDISPDQADYPHLSMVTLTAVGTSDFAFSNWSGDASGNTNPLVVTMDADITITAKFVLALTGYELWRYINFTTEERADDEKSGPDADYDTDGLTNNDEYLLGTNPKEKNGPHTLDVNLLGEGSIVLSPPGGGPYTYATEVTVTATGTPEFAFTGWSGDASGDTNPLVITLLADQTITANFSLDLDGFALFRYSEFDELERLNEDLAGPQADYDLDGLTNLEEYLLGTDPKVPDSGKGLKVGTVEMGGKLYLTITYNRSKDISGVTQTVEVGGNLENWSSGPAYSQEYAIGDNGDGTEAVTVRILDPLETLPRWFVRLVLEE